MKKINILLILLLCFTFTACNKSISFGVSQKYYLTENEQEYSLDNLIVKKYENLINIDSLNVPLNKYIFSKKYNVYIGVSFSVPANKLADIYKNNEKYQIIESQNESNAVNLFFSKENEFFYSYIYDSSKDKLTYILTLETDSANVKHKYEQNFLKQKLQK